MIQTKQSESNPPFLSSKCKGTYPLLPLCPSKFFSLSLSCSHFILLFQVWWSHDLNLSIAPTCTLDLLIFSNFGCQDHLANIACCCQTRKAWECTCVKRRLETQTNLTVKKCTSFSRNKRMHRYHMHCITVCFVLYYKGQYSALYIHTIGVGQGDPMTVWMTLKRL